MGLYRASTKGFFIFSFSRHKSVVMSENSRVSVVQWRTMTLIIVSIYGESNYGSLPLVTKTCYYQQFHAYKSSLFAQNNLRRVEIAKR